MTWICRAEWLAPVHPGAQVESCDARGETDSEAAKHTAETGHPTTSGPTAERSDT